MKKMLISMLAMAAMVSCSSESDPIDEVNPTGDSKVEIKLNTGVVSVATKATATADLKTAQISIVRKDGAVAPSDWNGQTIQNYTTDNEGKIALSGTQKYYSGTNNSYFLGISPQTAEATLSSNTVTFAITDGESDILCSALYDAGNKEAPNAANMKFDHMLSLVNIELVSTTTAASKFGDIISVKINKMPTSLALSLTDRKITATGESNNYDVFTSTDVTNGTAIASATLAPKFIAPGFGAIDNILEIAIETANFKGANARIIKINSIATTDKDNGTLAGYSHKITLTFKDDITIGTEVNTIIPGGEGNGEIDKE